MFESSTYIFIEMEYIQGEQLKKMYDRRVLMIRTKMGCVNSEEELRQR